MLENIFTPKKLIHRIWTSPTFTTWGHLSTRTFSLVFVLPLILTRLEAADIALWYLFRGIMDLQVLADVGLEATFTRVIAYAMGGAKELEVSQKIKEPTDNQPNWQIMEQICSTMNGLYQRVTLISFLSVGVIGSLVLKKSIAASMDTTTSWISWAVVLLTSSSYLYSMRYGSYLQGINQIALYRRWLVFTNLGEITTSFMVLFTGGGLLGLTLATQSWKVLSMIINRWLCRKVESRRFTAFKGNHLHKSVMTAIWPSAWRSGLGRFMSYGLVQISGIIYAQIGTVANIASYLLSLRLILTVSDFSRAPFYSKIPTLARYLSEGKIEELIAWAQRGMSVAYWTFIAGFIGLSLFFQPILNLIDSNVDFVDPLMWSLLGLGFFVERYGAMHIQLFSTTNKIIWHIANGISGIIFLLLSLILFPQVGVLAFPLGYLGGHLGFYAWYSAIHSYKAFHLRFWSFEGKTMLGPLSVLLVYCTIVVFV
jgi:hypothetical protein